MKSWNRKKQTNIRKTCLLLIMAAMCGFCGCRQEEKQEENTELPEPVQDSAERTEDAAAGETAPEQPETAPEQPEPGTEERFAEYIGSLWEEEQKAVVYQAFWECDFLVSAPRVYALEQGPEDYRNVGPENLMNEEGERINRSSAAVADVVIDKYIRDYGGEDTEYTLEPVVWGEDGTLEYECVYNGKTYEQPRPIHFAKITGGREAISFLVNPYTHVVSVRLGSHEEGEARTEEFMEMVMIPEDKLYDVEESQFWMLINPECATAESGYRNVAPDRSRVEEGTLLWEDYYIADSVIGQYIRERSGWDTDYGVDICESRVMDAQGHTSRALQLDNSLDVLEVVWDDLSMLVSVSIFPKESSGWMAWENKQEITEFEFGDIASQEELDAVGEMTALQRLVFSPAYDDGKEMDFSVLGSLKELRELQLDFENADSTSAVDFSFLRELDKLERLYIRKARIADLSFLSGLENLKELHLTYVDDCDFSYLQGMDDMEEMTVCGMHVRNYETLAGMVHMRRLELGERRRTPEEERTAVDLRFTADMKELSYLQIDGLHVDSVEPLVRNRKLQTVFMTDTEIEDISPLWDLENLNWVGVYEAGSENVENQAEGFDSVIVTISEETPWFKL